MSSSSTSTTSATSASTTDPPLAFWSLADSLISSYYPSTTITNINDLTFPPTVVIGGSTIVASSTVLDQTPTSRSSILPTSSISGNQAQQSSDAAAPVTSTASPSHQRSDEGDRNLGIILGVVLGAISLGLLVTLIWCLRRRRQHRGLQERQQPSPSQTEIASEWRRETTGTPQMWLDLYNRQVWQHTPPVSKHPAFIHSLAQPRTPAERSDPFLSSQERVDAPLAGRAHSSSREMVAAPAELDATPSAAPSTAMLQHSRSPYTRDLTNSSGSSSVPFYTPDESVEPQYRVAPLDFLSPAESAQQSMPFLEHHEPTKPAAPVFPMPYNQSRQLINNDLDPPSHSRYSPYRDSNPFMSQEENDTSTDAISPILPVRNPKRGSAPKIHYPSWKEVSGFNFMSEGDPDGNSFDDSHGRQHGEAY
ncbi:hypothetical protein K431DRAFT_283666 [Polychaeton citri CBS 116435]|uniref:Uncharacterized protein n=1 Tax=Polychaeton citri CBS 116435 TaxID=1314669 RepID=A0A9P4QAY3_9PEZI|nr:hypothetical protein K431DRAFT_283666 [Polychaeton citri CBS 116435]